MPAPPQLPEWATDAGASITEPAAAKKGLGWAGGGEKPPHGFFNWWQNLVYLWLAWLNADGSTASFPSIAEAVNGRPVGAIIHVSGAGSAPWYEAWSKTDGAAPTNTGGPVRFVACDGLRVYILTNDWIIAYNATDGAVVWSQNLPGFFTTATDFDTDGRVVAVPVGSSVNIFDAATGATLTGVSHGTAVTAVALDGDRLYLSDSTGRVFAYANPGGGGAVLWSDVVTLFGVTINSVSTNGKRVAVASDNYGGAPGNNVTVFDADSGALVLQELAGGSGANALSSAFHTDALLIGNNEGSLSPCLFAGPLNNSAVGVGEFRAIERGVPGSQNFDPLRLRLTEHYIVATGPVSFGAYRYGNGAGLSAALFETGGGVTYNDAACDPLRCLLATDAIGGGGGKTLRAMAMHARPLTARVVDVTSRYRAPFYGVIQEQ